MKEFIDKLIERLEEARKIAYNTYDNYGLNVDLGRAFGAENAIEIVNQLAEEYKREHIVDLCNQICNKADEILQKKNNGWIPCSERLPEDRKEKLVYLSSSRITIAIYNEHRLPHSGCAIGWGYDSSSGYIDFENETVIAWMPLPAPYQPVNTEVASEWKQNVMERFERVE